MSQTMLDVRDVRKVFPQRGGDKVAVDGVSLTLSQGDAVGLVGESGSGKTTLARMIVGLERPTAGSISYNTGDAGDLIGAGGNRMERARAVQMVFQDPYGSLDPRQTGRACLLESIRLHGSHSTTPEAAILELADRVGLTASMLERRPRDLSGGQRQRLAIARALAVNPRVVVFDEAVSALDVSIQAQVLQLIVDLRRELGLTYVFVTHDLAVVNAVTDHIHVMQGGKFVESGPTRQVLETPGSDYTRRLIDSVLASGWTPPAGSVSRHRLLKAIEEIREATRGA